MKQFLFKKIFCLSLTLSLAAGAFALTVQVDPVSGVDNGFSPFQTIPAALAAIAGADAGPDTVNLRTNGVHTLSAQLVVNAAAADGDLTIQVDPGDSGSAVIRLPGTAGFQIVFSPDGGQTINVSGVSIIGGTGTGAVGGDGIQVARAAGAGIATVNFTDCVFAANDGTDNPVPYNVNSRTVTGASWPGDDYIDYFENTAGTLTNVKISHTADEGIIVRGSQSVGNVGADVTITGDSAITYCGGRAVQLPFQADPSDTPLKFNMIGSPAERIRIFGNVVDNPEPTVTFFNGDVTLQYVDIVGNNDVGIRVDTDTCDSLNIECTRVAENNGTQIVFLFTTGDLTQADIKKSTFHNSLTNVALEVDAAVTGITINVEDSIFTGSGDQINSVTGNTATLNFTNCALVQIGADALGTPVFADLPPTSELNTVAQSPNYVSKTFDVTDPQNADFLRVTDLQPVYLTASTLGGELTGGACLPIVNVPPPTAAESVWSMYE
ncbi:MAG: hypothetical protein Kow0059_04980 [Candidatus Sumerlaeia bacterium]